MGPRDPRDPPWSGTPPVPPRGQTLALPRPSGSGWHLRFGRTRRGAGARHRRERGNAPDLFYQPLRPPQSPAPNPWGRARQPSPAPELPLPPRCLLPIISGALGRSEMSRWRLSGAEIGVTHIWVCSHLPKLNFAAEISSFH